MQRLFAEASRLEERNLPFAIVTIVSVEGHVPRKEGRMLVDLSASGLAEEDLPQ